MMNINLSITRQCLTCNKILNLKDNFPIVRSGLPYRTHKCNVCTREYKRTWELAHIDELTIRNKARWQRERKPGTPTRRRTDGLPKWKREETKRSVSKWKKNNRLRIRLSNKTSEIVRRAIKNGVLIRPTTCEQCGKNSRIYAAHSDYSKPLDIRWLCASCHIKWDSKDPKTISSEAIKISVTKRNAGREKTHCPHGHSYDSENTYIDKKGGRRCRQCNREGRRVNKITTAIKQ